MKTTTGRKLDRLMATPFLLAGLMAQNAKDPVSVPTDQRAEVYGVYTTLLAGPSLSHAEPNRKYVIEKVTATLGAAGDPARCIEVPQAYRTRLQEILADFERRKSDRYIIDRAFGISEPYELVDGAGAKEFVSAREHGASEKGRFAGAIDLITLSNVYFDKKRKLALVQLSSWCGSLCGMWRWRVLEKVGDRWVDRDWVRCFTVS